MLSGQFLKERPHQIQSLVQVKEQKMNFADTLHSIELDQVFLSFNEEVQMFVNSVRHNLQGLLSCMHSIGFLDWTKGLRSFGSTSD